MSLSFTLKFYHSQVPPACLGAPSKAISSVVVKPQRDHFPVTALVAPTGWSGQVYRGKWDLEVVLFFTKPSSKALNVKRKKVAGDTSQMRHVAVYAPRCQWALAETWTRMYGGWVFQASLPRTIGKICSTWFISEATKGHLFLC